MKFDSNQAWKQASSQVAANRDVLIGLAGVFFLLPALGFSLFRPQPAPQPGAPAAEMLAFTRDYYLQALPFLLGVLVLQAIGTLAMLTLFTDRARPTVAESIRAAVYGVLPYFGAQLVLGVGIGIVAGVVLTLATLSRVQPLVGIAFVALIVLAAYFWVKTSLVAPAVAVERVRNPLTALRRSWRLTDGNSVRIALFYLLIVVVFVVTLIAVMAILGVVLALILPVKPATVLSATVSAAIGATMQVYFVAVLAAVHRQLAGPSLDAQRSTFE